MFIMVVIGKGVIYGVLFCDVVVIENFCKVIILIVDKIGILIEGWLVFDCVVLIVGYMEDEVLCLVVSLDVGSEYFLVVVIV